MFRWLGRWFGLGAPMSRRGVRDQVRDSVSEQRRQAAVTLGTIDEPWALDDLLVLVKDMVGVVREAARESLRKKGADAVPVLVKALEDADRQIAIPAAEMLGDLKHPDSIRPLVLVMKFGTVEVRAAAIRALIQCGSVAVPELTAAARDGDPWSRGQAEAILDAIRANETATAQPEPGA